jgi:hypothetical protein
MRTLLEALDLKCADFGFGRLPHRLADDLSYDRWVHHEIRQSVGLNLRIVAGVVRLDSPQVSIRFSDVENLVAKFEQVHSAFPALTTEQIARRSTLGFLAEAQSVFPAFSRKTWNIWKEADIEPMAADFVDYVVKVSKPFWDKYSDPEATLTLLLEDNEEARTLTGADHFRAQKTVAMTYLQRGLDDAKKVAEQKLPKIRHDSYREEFRGWATRFFRQTDEA